jgi:hypothetical protein
MFWRRSAFRRLIGKRLGKFLKTNRFAEAASIKRDLYEAYVFRSTHCKLGIYDHRQEGEVNGMLAWPSAPDTLERKDGWHYVYALKLHGANLSIDELQKRVPEKPRSGEAQLDDIAKVLEREFPRLLTVLAELQPR